MPVTGGTEFFLIRHAPVQGDGRVYGRRDLPARLDDPARFAALDRALPKQARLITSPALRCQQTAQAIRPDADFAPDPALWEQDFGAWEGLPHSELPDLGPLDGVALAGHRPPDGESFDDVCARVAPCLMELSNKTAPVVVICHAGTIRAALAWAMGATAPALRFDVAPLSLTRITALPGAGAIVNEVNQCPG